MTRATKKRTILACLAVLLVSGCATQTALPDLALTPSGKAPAFDDAIAAFEQADHNRNATALRDAVRRLVLHPLLAHAERGFSG